MTFNIQRAVITGGTGVLGHALVRELLQDQVEVTVILREDSPNRQSLTTFQDPHLHILSGDLSDLGSLSQKIPVPQDAFFHLGWVGTYGKNREDQLLQNRNIAYTKEAAELAYALGCHTFVGAGSQAEYGPAAGKTGPETEPHPVTAYGKAKLRAGKESRALADRLSIRHIWVRFYSVFGPWDHDYTLMGSTLKKARAHERLSFTKGDQIWDYLYSLDGARALILAAQKGKNGAVYCVGGQDPRPLRDYLEVFCHSIDPTAPLYFGEVPYYNHQAMHLEADNTALTRDTGFVPRYSFEEGVRDYLRT